jgi:hypothetical protein
MDRFCGGQSAGMDWAQRGLLERELIDGVSWRGAIEIGGCTDFSFNEYLINNLIGSLLDGD